MKWYWIFIFWCLIDRGIWLADSLHLLSTNLLLSAIKSFLLLKVVVFQQRYCSIEGSLALKVFFHQWLSSIGKCLSSKDVFNLSSSSIGGCLPSKVVSYRGSTSIEGGLIYKFIFHKISVHFPPKVILHQMSTSTKGHPTCLM